MSSLAPGQQSLLIVEDNFDDYYAIRRALIATGWRGAVHYAATGEQAWELLNHTSDQLPIDLLLLDLCLPGMGGEELLHRIRGHATHGDLKVVIFSGCTDPLTKARCRALGVEDIVAKPNDIYDFVLTLRDVFTGRSVGRQALDSLRTQFQDADTELAASG